MSAFTLQRERRQQALEPLRDHYASLRQQITDLRAKMGQDKHRDQIIDNDLLPVLWQAQEIWAQLSAIEAEMYIPYRLAFVLRESTA